MSTLRNVETRGDGASSPSVGLISGSIPEAQSPKTGVSVRYAPDADKRWWVLRATYGREKLAYDYITTDGLDSDAYYAMHHVVKLVRGKKTRMTEALVPSILFVYCTVQQIYDYVKNTPPLSFVRFYYDHCTGDGSLFDPPVQIPYDEMMNFIRLTTIDDDNIIRVDKEFIHYRSGDLVRVTEGRFAGIIGRVARAAGQQRIIVELQGVALVATAYVRSQWIEKI